MNWPRIAIGGLIAALILWVFDLSALVLSQRMLVSEPNLSWSEFGPIALSLIVPSLIKGFLLSWLYVLTRPRLGPGPKNALLVGTIGFAFAHAHFFNVTILFSSGSGYLIPIAGAWLKFAVATYLAGWQYIEKAPS